LFDDQILTAIGPLRAVGFALHWLHPKSKRPIGDDWSTKPVADRRPTHPPTRRRQQSRRAPRRTITPDRRELPARDRPGHPRRVASRRSARRPRRTVPGHRRQRAVVRSGSGGSSRHFYFACDRRSRRRSSRAAASRWSPTQARARCQEARLGNRAVRHRQASRHAAVDPPGYGQAVRLGAAVRPRQLALGVSPFIPSSHLDSLGIIDMRRSDARPQAAARADRGRRFRTSSMPCRSRNTARTATGGCRSAWRCTTRPAAARTASICGAISASSREIQRARAAQGLEQLQARRPTRSAWRPEGGRQPGLLEQFDDRGDECAGRRMTTTSTR
jgi:hypothetical protein